MKAKRAHFAVIVGACVAALSVNAHADIINGSFEDGLTGWSSLGLTGAVGTVGPHAPTDGLLQGALEATEYSPINDEQISNALGLPMFTVSNPYGPPDIVTTTIFELLRQDFNGGLSGCYEQADDCLTEGSALLYQSFDVEAGQTLSFDWNLLGVDCCTADSAYVTLTTADMFLAILLSDTRSNVLPINPAFGDVPLLCIDSSLALCGNSPNMIFGGATGYQSLSLDILSSGTATLGFSLINSSGPSPHSGLLIDNIQLVSVPEPGTLALLLAGLAAMGVFVRRRKV